MMTFFIQDVQTFMVPVFIAGLFSCWRTNLAYIYIQELFSSKFQGLVGTLFLMNDVFTMLYSTIFFT
jgi:hypothetical protein